MWFARRFSVLFPSLIKWKSEPFLTVGLVTRSAMFPSPAGRGVGGEGLSRRRPSPQPSPSGGGSVTLGNQRVAESATGITKRSGGQTLGSGGQALASGGQTSRSDRQTLTVGAEALAVGGQALRTSGQTYGAAQEALMTGGQTSAPDGRAFANDVRARAAGEPAFASVLAASGGCANGTPVHFARADIDAGDWCHRDSAFPETAQAKMPANRTQDACAPTAPTAIQSHVFSVMTQPRKAIIHGCVADARRGSLPRLKLTTATKENYYGS